MKKEFVPYEQALELKQLGFNEECFSYYTYPEGKFSNVLSFNSYKNTALKTSSPTFSQAFKWFRENYGLESSIVFHENYSYQGKTNVYETNIEKRGENSRYFFTPIEGFITYEEAELECLKKLIEIVKSK